jgi:hypothetical protein
MTIEQVLSDRELLREVCDAIREGERDPWPELMAAARRRAAAAGQLGASLPWLNVVNEIRRAEEAALVRLTPAGRMLAYRKGRMTRYQVRAWESRFPRETPRVNGLPEWDARHLIDVVEGRR